jgi:hypothetical protein
MAHTIDTSRASIPLKWTCPPGRSLPPFGKVLADAFLAGLQPRGRQASVYLDAWPPRPAPFGPALTCPEDAEPEALDWRILAALDVLVTVPAPCDGDRLRRLLAELVAVKPRRLIVLRSVAPHVEFIVTAARGVEVHP